MNIASRKKMGFSLTPLHKKREPHAFHYLSQRASFWIAALSLVAFVSGNMVGQHGWYAFWKSVLGKVDDSAIVYTGTVTPIEKVPDYEKWSAYGGNPDEHTFRQVPEEVLRDLPRYTSTTQQQTDVAHGYGNDVYSVGYLGSYTTGAEASGSHPGVDIRAPEGTPVRSIANGIVETAVTSSGFGKLIVIRHPNVPDPSNPKKTTTLYSSYAHLSAIYVTEGSVVQKGEHIADSGSTGIASGPHLHFQIDKEDAPWHPYWPFTTSEASKEGLTSTQAINAGLFQSRGYLYTVNPLLYVQANFASPTVTIASADSATDTVVTQEVKAAAPVLTAAQRREQAVALLQSRREDRLQDRLARRTFAERSIAKKPEETNPVILSTQTVVSALAEEPASTSPYSADVTSVRISHDGSFTGRGWETVRIVLLDAQGNTVTQPRNFEKDVYMRTAYGTAEFRPAILSPLDFVNGEAKVNMLPRGRRTIVIQVQPFNVLSTPMVYGRE